MIYWLTQTLGDIPDNEDWLGTRERTLKDALRIPKRRADWLLGRWTGKHVAAAYLQETAMLEQSLSGHEGNSGMDWSQRAVRCDDLVQINLSGVGMPTVLSEIEILAASDGAPQVFLRDQPAPVTISISDSNGVGFCCAASQNHAIGCDLEKIEPRSPEFVADFFTAAEMTSVQAASVGDQALLATLIWSAKESALKALRTGLRLDTRCIEVECHSYQRPTGWMNVSVCGHNQASQFQGRWRCWNGFVQTVVKIFVAPD